MLQPNPLDFLNPTAEQGIAQEQQGLATNPANIGTFHAIGRSFVGNVKSLAHSAFAIGRAAKDTVEIPYDLWQTGHLDYSDAAANLKLAAEDNVATAYGTQNHGVASFIGGMAPFVLGAVATDGVSSVLGLSARAASGVADEVTLTALNNARYLKSMPTKAFAKDVGVGQAWAAQGALGLDDKGNATIDPEAYLFNSALSLGLAGVMHASALRSSNNTMARIIDERRSFTPVESLKDEKGSIKPATDEEVKDIVNETSSDYLKDFKTADLNVNPQHDEAITTSQIIDNDDSLTHAGLFTSAKAIQTMIDNGVNYNGELRSFTDLSLHSAVDNDLKIRQDMLATRGAKKVSLTKSLNESAPAELDKWHEVIDAGTKVQYRSTGNLLGSGEEHFLQFHAKNLTADIVNRVKKASANGDSTAQKLEALINLSATHNLEADTKVLKSLQRNIILWKNGVLDIARNYTQDDVQALDTFVNKTFANNEEYFKNPKSSGYVKLSNKWNSKEFEDLVNCLIKFS